MKSFSLITLVLMAVVGCTTIGRANDSSLDGAGGSWQPLQGENRFVSMERESIQMDIFANYGDVTVDFDFHNSGPATVVKMGFPEDTYPADNIEEVKKTSFLRFSTSVDGKPTKISRIHIRPQYANLGADPDPLTMGYTALWMKSVPFASGQTRRVRVSYRSRFSGAAVIGANRFLPYLFTGKNWKGKVKESRLQVNLREPGHYLIYDEPCGKPTKSHSGTTWNYRWTNWEAQGTFVFWFTRTTPNWMAYPNSLQLYDVNNKSGEEIRQMIQEATVAGKASTDLLWEPPLIDRNGIVYADITDLANQLSQQSPYRQDEFPINAFNTKTTASLRVGDTKISFWTDQNKAKIEGGSSIVLPGAPICIVAKHEWGWTKTFYVPLEATIRGLGGSAWVNREKRRAYFELPSFARG